MITALLEKVDTSRGSYEKSKPLQASFLRSKLHKTANIGFISFKNQTATRESTFFGMDNVFSDTVVQLMDIPDTAINIPKTKKGV